MILYWGLDSRVASMRALARLVLHYLRSPEMDGFVAEDFLDIWDAYKYQNEELDEEISDWEDYEEPDFSFFLKLFKDCEKLQLTEMADSRGYEEIESSSRSKEEQLSQSASGSTPKASTSGSPMRTSPGGSTPKASTSGSPMRTSPGGSTTKSSKSDSPMRSSTGSSPMRTSTGGSTTKTSKKRFTYENFYRRFNHKVFQKRFTYENFYRRFNHKVF
ncbi:hypothetical protein CDAR_288231 [Caerostris darwini]|uniref:Uncharacterized protein n=1 Tax=Caerostris darwini TaxID=1538125 RepID=A0AAV4WAY3_9ARAC|nr:hypothetical protein CDAR_288231 [Caerostris darwini]